MSKPDETAEWWSVTEIAAYLGVRRATVSAYLHRGQMPKPDTRIGDKPGWRPASIVSWSRTRPGRGRRAARD